MNLKENTINWAAGKGHFGFPIISKTLKSPFYSFFYFRFPSFNIKTVADFILKILDNFSGFKKNS